MISANTPSRPSIGVFTRAKQFSAGTMLLASYGFGIRLKPQMVKGNFILRPTFSLALLAEIVGRLLGHTTTTTTKRYAHLADDPLRAAADRFGSKIAGFHQ
jgi:integrase